MAFHPIAADDDDAGCVGVARQYAWIVFALTFGLLTFPLSLLADRFGRVKSLALMALLWSVATLGCAVAPF
jgi:MFS family permease